MRPKYAVLSCRREGASKPCGARWPYLVDAGRQAQQALDSVRDDAHALSVVAIGAQVAH